MKTMQNSSIIKQHRRKYFNMKKKLLKKLSPQAKIIAEKEMLKSCTKRSRRKTLYPFGFEYASWRK